jgi:histidine kinase
MMLDSRKDINEIIRRAATQEGVETVRIYNKKGVITFSNRDAEIDQSTGIKAEVCTVCHASNPPLVSVDLAGRTRIFAGPRDYRLLGIINPIYNEAGCAGQACHESPTTKKVLGGLDVVVSLRDIDNEFLRHERTLAALAIVLFLGTAGIIGLFVVRSVNRPIKKLISSTSRIGDGEYDDEVQADRRDEIGQLALAINQMRKQIGEKQDELNKQKEEYRNLFEHAPCYVTVQDQDFKLLRYNREFAEKFEPKAGEYCYQAYKGRSQRCEICPVVETFEDGQPRTSEETGINKDGTRSFWMVRTSPIMNSEGKVVAAMEMSLDVTKMKFLENEVRKSEEKYRTIFDTIPNPVFVLDMKTLQILDCNDSMTSMYGFEKEEVIETSFLDFFEEDDRERYDAELKAAKDLNRVRQIRKNGDTMFVNIFASYSEYMGREVLLATANDVTARLMAEQQLIQASKMATLGEMATGVAHELNQPLSVIKTASSFFLKKIRKKEPVTEDVLETLAAEMDSHVDRASKIITHMREFGRQSEVKRAEVQVNEALRKALEIFSQQLKLRQIEVVRDLAEDLPPIMADLNRLEQVFINLLTNARDAIEERWQHAEPKAGEKKIFLKTTSRNGTVIVQVRDNGKGVPATARDRIFDPFFTTKEAGKGTGLGLSISYGIVRDYGGSIRVESQEGEGATFTIEFPVAG